MALSSATRSTLSGLAAIFLLLAAPAVGQEDATPAAEETFIEQIAVDIVNVEVYVTDKEGNPVSGLTREDFAVSEDGRPVEVVNFYFVANGKPGPQPGPERIEAVESAEQLEDPPPLPLERVPEVVVPENQRLHLVIYVDNFNIHPLNRNRVFKRLREFLHDTVERGDEVLVASYDRSLKIRQPFTGSPQIVSEVLREIEGMSGSAIERESERSQAIKDIYETDSLHTAQWHAKNFSENQYHEVNNTLDALREMLDSLAGLPGRKMLLHVSDGIPMVPGQDLYQAIQQRFMDLTAMSQSFGHDLSRRFTQIIAQANSDRVSFYTIDAGGLRTQSGMGAENPAINWSLSAARAVEVVRMNNLQDPLIMMANRTGGQYIINTNDVSEGLERFARDVGNYYSLGYRAPTTERGRYHKIEVRLKDGSKEWRLRHREGYRDKSLEAQVGDSVRAFLVHGYETNPLDVSIELGDQSPAGDGNIAVPVRVRIPMENIVLLPRGEFYEGRLRLYFGATDEDGREAPLQELPLGLRIPESSIERARQDEVARVFDATMRPGPHKLVIAVRDEISEERSIVGRYLTVGNPQDREKDTLPPALDFRRQ
jgi:VWFA-related protein